MEDIDINCKYRDGKVGHQRSYLDYLKYKKFIIKRLNSEKYNKVVVFGIQLSYFLKKYLVNKYKGQYILDIRDSNKIIHYFNIKKIINNSKFVALSSSGYKEWLPKSDKYIINHNTQIENLSNLKHLNFNFKDKKLNISYIGALRDLEVNLEFIESLKNSVNISLFYHGEGVINKNIHKYVVKNNIQNVQLTGRYNRKDEGDLYYNSDVINVLRYNDSINNKTALPNRLYNAVFQGKILLALKGTYLAELVEMYNLGLTIDSFSNLEERIYNYLNEFNVEQYLSGRSSFLEFVIKDNEEFKFALINFISK